MNLRAQLRTAATTSLLALAIVSLTATATHAAPVGGAKQDCIDRGYVWYDKWGCADRHCAVPGSLIPVRPGTNFFYNGKVYACDGFTGQFTEVKGRTMPSGPGSMTGAPTTGAQP